MPDQDTLDGGTDRRVPAGAVLLASPAEVASVFDRLAAEVGARLTGRRPLVVAVLEGGRMPAEQLSARLTIPHDTDALRVGRYGNSSSGGMLRWSATTDSSLQGRTVLIVDDILDQGVTLSAVVRHCRDGGATDVLTCVLTVKDLPERTGGPWPDFVGLVVPDQYIVGCGMDYQGRWRELPGLYALEDLA